MNYYRQRILVVDDEPRVLNTIRATFRDATFEVITASSGREGLEILKTGKFAAILLDLQMPGMDGFETALWIRARDITTPIIFLASPYTRQSKKLRGFEAGAVDYIFKPFDVDILRAKTAMLVELQRKQIEVEAKSALIAERAESRYRDLVRGLTDAIVWSSVVGRYTFNFVSPSAEKISGYPPEVWMSSVGFMLSNAHPEDVETIGTATSHLLATNEPVEFEHRFIRPDGSMVWLRTSIRIAEIGGQREFRGISVDITDLKNKEQRLREAIDVRDEFLSIAAHELKTPLTPLQLQIDGFQRLHRRGELDKLPASTIARMLDVSAAQVDTLSRLVTQLMDVSSIKAGRIPIEKKRTDLSALVRKVVEVFQTNFALERVRVDLDLPDSLTGEWDAGRLEQVLVNLIDNAIKYGLGKPVRITLREESGRAQLTVRDQGLGISPEQQQRIFPRFERAVSADNYSGMGLGLYIAQQIAELHGGEIRLESRPEEGSAFTLTLPLNDSPAK